MKKDIKEILMSTRGCFLLTTAVIVVVVVCGVIEY